MSKVKRIGKKEKEIISYMEKGWELCKGRGYAFLQEKGVGSGGKTIDIPYERVSKLQAKGIIYVKSRSVSSSTLILCKDYKEKL